MEWLFVLPSGKPFCKGSWGYYWRPVRAAFERELPRSHWLRRRLELNPNDHLDFYELRHHCGSLLADRGCSARDIAEQVVNSEQGCTHIYVDPDRDHVRPRIYIDPYRDHVRPRIYIDPYRDHVRARGREAFEQPEQVDRAEEARRELG